MVRGAARSRSWPSPGRGTTADGGDSSRVRRGAGRNFHASSGFRLPANTRAGVPALVHITVRLRPSDWLASTQAEGRRLVIASAEPARPGQPVALQVELAGHPARATVFGKAHAVRDTAVGRHLEIATAPESLAAVGLLTAAARGQSVSFRERAGRRRTSLPAVVGRTVFMVVTSVSGNGCSLRWSGPAPAAGQAIRLRVGAGAQTCDLAGVVRWVRASGAATLAGVRVNPADGQSRAWQALIEQVSRAGAARC